MANKLIQLKDGNDNVYPYGILERAKIVDIRDSDSAIVNNPWLAIKKHYSEIPQDVTVVGALYIGTIYSYIGMRISDLYSSFLIFSYNEIYPLIKVTVYGGNWVYRTFNADSVIPFT